MHQFYISLSTSRRYLRLRSVRNRAWSWFLLTCHEYRSCIGALEAAVPDVYFFIFSYIFLFYAERAARESRETYQIRGSVKYLLKVTIIPRNYQRPGSDFTLFQDIPDICLHRTVQLYRCKIYVGMYVQIRTDMATERCSASCFMELNRLSSIRVSLACKLCRSVGIGYIYSFYRTMLPPITYTYLINVNALVNVVM